MRLQIFSARIQRGVVMETRELFREATYGPDALKLMCRAFDEAWESIAGNFGDDPKAIEIARTRLASAILSLPQDEIKDVEQIKSPALQALALSYKSRAEP
jgi:hypothetical protein